MNDTTKIRLWRFAGEPPGPWRTGPTPAVATGPIDFAWALLADEPLDATGRPPSPGDQLIGFLEGHDAVFGIVHRDGRQWQAYASTRERPALGHGDTVVDALMALLEDAGVKQ